MGSEMCIRDSNPTIAGNLTVSGTSTLTGNSTVGGTLGVTGASTLTGNTTFGGTITGGASSDIAINTNKFTVAAATGNTVIAGNLTVSGTTTTIDTTVENVDKLEVGANSTDYGAKINQTGTGNILQLQDGGTDAFVVADGGIISTDITMATNKKIKQKGEFLTHSSHRAWVLGS